MEHVVLPVQGQLDTANPVTNRADGTLVEAIDVSPLWWGPRFGFTQQTWPNRVAGCYLFDGTDGYVSCVMRSKQQFNLPTAWTLDVVFRPTLVSHSTDVSVPIFQWDLNGVEAIGLYILANGESSGNRRKIRATVTPTSAPGVAGSGVTITGTTQQSVGTSMLNTHHARLVRNGANLTLTVDNLTEATSTSLSATQRHEAAVAASTSCTAYLATGRGIATGANHLFNGRIMRTLLRVGAATDPAKGFRDFQFPEHPSVRFCQRGIYGMDLSSFTGTLGISSSGTTLDTETPAPWSGSPVQGGTYWKDSRGRGWNVVVTEGNLYWRRVH